MPFWIYFSIAFSLSISLFAIGLVINVLPSPSPEESGLLTIAEAVNLIVILITSTAFIIAGYFAFQTIKMTTITENLDRKQKKLIKMLSQLAKKEESIEKIRQSFDKNSLELTNSLGTVSELANSLDIIFTQKIVMLDILPEGKVDDKTRKNNTKLRIDAYRARARLSYIKQMDFERRLILLGELTEFGDETDIAKLQDIINNKNETDKIIEKSTFVKRYLESKFNHCQNKLS